VEIKRRNLLERCKRGEVVLYIKVKYEVLDPETLDMIPRRELWEVKRFDNNTALLKILNGPRRGLEETRAWEFFEYKLEIKEIKIVGYDDND